jgi:signal recognition particle subunit SRP54
MHRQMADMMKAMGKRGMMGRMMGGLGGGMGGMIPGMGGGRGGAAPSPEEIEQMQAELSRLDPRALEQLPDELKDMVAGAKQSGGKSPAKPSPAPGLPGGLPGLGGGMPGGLPGLPGLGGPGRMGMPTPKNMPGKKKKKR